MASISLADQLQDAIEMMIAEPDSPPPKVDLKIGDLLGIVAELRLLPDPDFRAMLKAELLGQKHAVPIAIASQTDGEGQARRDGKIEDILPTLFGAGYGNYPVHRGNFAVSLAMHAALIAAVAGAGMWITRQPSLAPHATTVLVTDISPYVLPPSSDRSRGGGGGGDRDKVTESKGSLPRFSREQITPPTVVVRNEQPKLPAEPTVVGPPALSVPPRRLRLAIHFPRFSSNSRMGPDSGAELGMEAVGESGQGPGLELALDMAVALAVACFAWAAGSPRHARSTLLTLNIPTRPVKQNTRGRWCSGLSSAQRAGRVISAYHGRWAWVSMKKLSRQCGSGNSSLP